MNSLKVFSGSEVNDLFNELRELRIEVASLKDILINQNYEYRSVATNDEPQTSRILDSEALDYEIRKKLLEYKIPVSNKGYTYLLEAVEMVYHEPDLIKGLYVKLSDKHKDSVACVERAIRHSMECAWFKPEIQKLITHNLGFTTKPKSREFIARFAESIRMNGKWI